MRCGHMYSYVSPKKARQSSVFLCVRIPSPTVLYAEYNFISDFIEKLYFILTNKTVYSILTMKLSRSFLLLK